MRKEQVANLLHSQRIDSYRLGYEEGVQEFWARIIASIPEDELDNPRSIDFKKTASMMRAMLGIGKQTKGKMSDAVGGEG